MSAVRSVLRRHYSAALPLVARPGALGAALLLSACSLSVPGFGGDGPAVTGALPQPVTIQQPLPQTLAYSDATKIGQSALSALSQVDRAQSGNISAAPPSGDAVDEWVNKVTGSSGTMDAGDARADGCRDFSTLVTSVGGVHRYSGQVCPGAGASPVVRIDTTTPAPTAG